jgi:hypothetical protein
MRTATSTQPAPAVDSVRSTTRTDGHITTPVVAALEAAWADIRAHHPDLPPAVIILGAGSVGVPAGQLKLGHFAAMRWHNERDGLQLAEVFIGGEGLARGATGVLGTLLHEAAHALAHVRGIQDTSRQGRWHNARFKQLAEEVGITVTKDPRIGWSPTTIQPATPKRYTRAVRTLTSALRLYRSAEISIGTIRKPSTPPAVCACDRKIRIPAATLAAGPVLCGLCGSEFAPQPQDQP